MFQIHFHVHAGRSAAAEGGANAQAIGDGTILRLIAQYGPQLLALLVKLGLIKLPVGAETPEAHVSDKF